MSGNPFAAAYGRPRNQPFRSAVRFRIFERWQGKQSCLAVRIYRTGRAIVPLLILEMQDCLLCHFPAGRDTRTFSGAHMACGSS